MRVRIRANTLPFYVTGLLRSRLASCLANAPVQRRAAQRTVRCNRLFGGNLPIQAFQLAPELDFARGLQEREGIRDAELREQV